MILPHRLRRLALVALGALLPSVLVAQDSEVPGDRAEPVSEPRLRVFLDCPTGGCDRNFFVTEMPFALWTQDRLDADVHALITGIGTGAGGTEYTLALL